MHVHCASQHNGNDWNVIVSRQLVSNLDVSICIMAKIAHTVAKPIRISRSTNRTSSCRQPHYSLACIVWCASRIMFIHTFHGFSMMANTPAPTRSSWKKKKKSSFLSDSKFPTTDHEESNTRHGGLRVLYLRFTRSKFLVRVSAMTRGRRALQNCNPSEVL